MGRRARHDAVVIGGGPAGSAAATTLARAGRSVLLVVDRAASRSFRVGEGAPPGFDRAVDDVFGAGTFVAADHLPSYGNRAAWGSGELVENAFMHNAFGAGWHLDRVAFDTRLLEAAASAGVDVVDVDDVPDRQPDLAAPLNLDASGRRAVFARRHGARLVTSDRLTAVVAVFGRTDGDTDTTTTVESVESGWWYTSAIPGRRRVVAFLTDGDLLGSQHRSVDGFVDHVATTRHVSALVGKRPDELHTVAAGTARLDRPVGDGWIAVGDAAACFDPLSSQGILTAVLMGGVVTESPEAYAARYASIIEQYRAQQRATYALEQRWPDAPFWRRRQA